MTTLEKAYKEIFKALNKHRDICVFDVEELERKSKIHLHGTELKDKYGLTIDPKRINSLDYNNLNDYCCIGWWGEKYRRTVSWSDDGRQPNEEYLLQINFPTGAYIFGQDYPAELFQKFWLELISFKPDYTDTHNHGLFWKIENAKDVFNSFNDIIKKYYELNKEDYKQRQVKKLKEELFKLENA